MYGFQTLVMASLSLMMPFTDVVPIAERTQADELYTDCLADLGLRGDYTWTDGGASALRLATACQILGKPVIAECMKLGLNEKSCSFANVLYAQAALKALHK
jgi:hypothetical protein